jgi:uncharacterized membrane protein
MAVGPKGQDGLIMWILRRTLMILVMKTIGHNGGFQQPINRREFKNRTRANSAKREKFHNFRGHDDI